MGDPSGGKSNHRCSRPERLISTETLNVHNLASECLGLLASDSSALEINLLLFLASAVFGCLLLRCGDLLYSGLKESSSSASYKLFANILAVNISCDDFPGERRGGACRCSVMNDSHHDRMEGATFAMIDLIERQT